MSAISDIRHQNLLFQYGNKYVGLNPLIVISEEFRYRHQLPFRRLTKSISDIPISQIDQSSRMTRGKFYEVPIIFLVGTEPMDPCNQTSVSPLCYEALHTKMSDIGQKFIPISNIMSDSALFSPISDVPISGWVRYRWSLISDWVATFSPLSVFLSDPVSLDACTWPTHMTRVVFFGIFFTLCNNLMIW